MTFGHFSFLDNGREVHHMCVLLGYGADAICPYLIFDAARRLRHEGVLNEKLTDADIFKVSTQTRLELFHQCHSYYRKGFLIDFI